MVLNLEFETSFVKGTEPKDLKEWSDFFQKNLFLNGQVIKESKEGFLNLVVINNHELKTIEIDDGTMKQIEYNGKNKIEVVSFIDSFLPNSENVLKSVKSTLTDSLFITFKNNKEWYLEIGDIIRQDLEKKVIIIPREIIE